MIFTTNKPLAAWGRVLHDPDLADAILDHVLECGRHIELRRRSYRTRHALFDLTPGPEPSSPAPNFRKSPARISGTHTRSCNFSISGRAWASVKRERKRYP